MKYFATIYYLKMNIAFQQYDYYYIRSQGTCGKPSGKR